MNSKKQTGILYSLSTVVVCFLILITVVLYLIAGRATAAAGINQRLNFQGRLYNSAGAVIPDGDYNIEFKLVQDGDGCNPTSGTFPCSGTVQWTETRTGANKVTVKNGYFSVELGSVTGLPTSIWNQDTLWLSINIGGTAAPTWDGEMKPLKRLTASPYAMNSGQLNGLSSTNFLQLAQGIQTDTSTLNPSIFVNKNNVSGTPNILQLQKAGSDVLVVDNNGLVTAGQGLTIATSKSLTVNGDAFTDLTGNGLTISSSALTINLTAATDGLSSTTSSGSGLQVLSGGLTLLQGCADTQMLAWNETTDVWACSEGTATLDLDDVYTADSDKKMSVNNATGLLFDLTTTGDLIVQDAGVAFAQFLDDGTITLGKATAASTFNIGIGTGVDTINIGTGATAADAITIGNTGVATTLAFNSGATSNAILANINSVTTGTAIQLNATGLTTGSALKITGPSATDLLNVGRSNIGAQDFSRVAIGGALTRDQFTVYGRMTSTWRHVGGVQLGSCVVATITADTGGLCYGWSFDEDADGGLLNVGNNDGGLRLRASTAASLAVGEGASLSTAGTQEWNNANNPVVEATVRAQSGLTNARYEVGFDDLAVNADVAVEPSDGIYFRAATSGNWFAVTRAAGTETATDTGVAVSTTLYQKLRIEVEGTTRVRFLINGTEVAVNTTNITAVNLGIGARVALITAADAVKNFDVMQFEAWIDDPVDAGVQVNPNATDASSPVAFDAVQNSDLAEYYLTNNPADIPAGSLMALDPSLVGKAVLSNGRYDHMAIGVRSEYAGLMLGNDHPNAVSVALAGRVAVRVSNENGPIKPGDALVASSIPGVAMRGTKAGYSVGKALEAYDGVSETTIMMYVEPTYTYGNADYLLDQLSEEASSTDVLRNLSNSTNLADMSQIFTDKVVAGLEIITPSLTANKVALTTLDAVDNTGITVNSDMVVHGTLTVDSLKANQIEGLEAFVNNASTPAADSVASAAGTGGSVLGESTQSVVLDTANVKLDMIVDGMTNANGGLTVGGDASFHGMTIFHRLVQFVDKVVFRNDVTFEGNVTFSNNSGGFAIIHASQQEVQVKFAKPYQGAPVVNVNVSNGQFVEYAYKDLTANGFTIVLKDPAASDVQFVWSATSIADPLTQSVPVATP